MDGFASFFAKVALAFEHGGFWMYPILVFQIFSLAIIVERAYALFVRRRTNQGFFLHGLEDLIRRGELGKVIHLSESGAPRSPIARAVLSGAQVAAHFGGRNEIQGKMDEVLLHENAQLDRRVPFLAMLGNVATLTGLLGTITGMIKSFAAVAFANPVEKAALLSQGISQAMNCTAYGLIVAIPALLGYAILQNRVNLLAEDLNQSALKVFNWLSYNFDPVTLRNDLNRRAAGLGTKARGGTDGAASGGKAAEGGDLVCGGAEGTDLVCGGAEGGDLEVRA
ncbi:MAG: MotA/TolQ/ExbB proton channel family protein [Bdellovibrio sp.]|nr:MAG: MotA/TolQ/ExbB proton channel family protein [Bdellovibrio sp.]